MSKNQNKTQPEQNLVQSQSGVELRSELCKREAIPQDEVMQENETPVNDEFFTRQELHDYFAGRYQPEQIDKALFIFAQNGAELDPDGDRFSLSITEQLEEILKAVGKALENQKQLGAQQPDETLTVLEAQAIASKYSPHSSPKLIAAMVRLVTEEAIEIGSLLTQIKSDALGKTLEQGNLEIVRSLFSGAQQTTNYVRNLTTNDEQRNKILKRYGIEPVDINGFLEEVREKYPGVKNAVKALAPSEEKTFDMEAFLLEALD
jgi:hypothetical protein